MYLWLIQPGLQKKETQNFNLSLKIAESFEKAYVAISDQTLAELRSFSKEMEQHTADVIYS